MATVPNRAIFFTAWADPITSEFFPVSTNALITDQPQLDRIVSAQVAWLDPTFDKTAPGIIGGTTPGPAFFTAINGGPLAGARRLNINGAFEGWQRGDGPFTGNAGTRFADMWFSARNNMSLVRSSDTPDARFASSAEFSSTADTVAGIQMNIEARIARRAAGQRVTAGFWAKSVAGAGPLRVYFRTAGAEDNFSTVTLRENLLVTASVSAGWTFYEVTSAAPITGIENGLRVQIDREGSDTNQTRIAGVQVEPSTVATPFEFWPGDSELLARYRYFQRLLSGSLLRPVAGAGHATSATGASFSLGFLAPMRAAPTLAVSSAGHFALTASTGADLAATSIALTSGRVTQNRAEMTVNVASGLSSGNATNLRSINGAATFDLSAEL